MYTTDHFHIGLVRYKDHSCILVSAAYYLLYSKSIFLESLGRYIKYNFFIFRQIDDSLALDKFGSCKELMRPQVMMPISSWKKQNEVAYYNKPGPGPGFNPDQRVSYL